MKNQTGIKLVAAVGIAACMVGSAWGAGTIATVSSYAAPNMVAEINVALQEADVRLDAIEIGGVPDGNSIITGSVTFIQGGVTTQWDNAASLIDTAAIETGALPSGITVADANVATLFGVAKGGTGLASGTSGGVLAYTAAGTLASSALLAQYGIVLGGGAGAVPATLAASANTGAPLLSAGNAANPAYGPLNLAGGATIVTGDLPVSDGGTGAGTAAAAASALGVGTEDSPTFSALVLSNATTATGLSLDGTYTGNAIDFSGTTINPTGANGPCLIRAGTYATPIDYGVDSDQSGMIRVYSTSAGTSSYDRAIFAYTEVTSSKGGFPISGLAEANNTGTGPSKLQAGQLIAHLGAQSSGAHLTTAAGDGGTGGMFGLWAKVAASATATCDSGSIVAAIWADNAMSGTSSGTEYGIYATTTGNTPDGFIGFKTYTSGYSQLLYFEDSFSSNAGTCVETAALGAATNQDARIKVWYDGAQYYIPLYKD